MPAPIAFLFPAFPNLHQTFVLWEVLALRERGIDIALYSIKRPLTKTQQPEGAALQAEVTYLPSTLSAAVLRANLALLARHPGRYLGAVAGLVRGWWQDRAAGRAWQAQQVSADAPDKERTLQETLAGWFNRSPVLYLFKSLWLIPLAAWLGADLERRGIRRLHAHWASYATTVALVAHWLYDIPFSFTAHAYDIYLVPRLLGVKVREAEFAVTCARVNAEFLNMLAGTAPGERVVVNYHGVSLDRFKPLPRPAAAPMPCIVTCGRLEPYKGHHVLLRAVAALDRPVRVVLIGEGPQRQKLAQLAAELGIGERVEFTGPLPQARLAEIYAGADLFVLASVIIERSGKRDVIPNVLAEAMAMRLPVVATSVSGIGELIADGVSGRLVAPNDPAALGRVLGELLDDPAQRQRLAAEGAATVAHMFDREVNIEELAALFRGAAAAARGAA
ncbi:MAG TPA: glycosyltransferase [Candidatus Dormibacteraeota bacterium]|nr:glycosyltransferase [Candidatus Dormibacteraeota bacterium]